jgi:hypothetical protein
MSTTLDALRRLSELELAALTEALLRATVVQGEPTSEQWWLASKVVEVRDEYVRRGAQAPELPLLPAATVDVLTRQEARALGAELAALAGEFDRAGLPAPAAWYGSAAIEVSQAARRRDDELAVLDGA